MADMTEGDFRLWLDVSINGYGNREHEDKMSAKVESILRLHFGDSVQVSVVRDSDKQDGSDDDSGGIAGPDRCDVCRRGEPEWQSGKVIYRCVKCGSEMNVPEQPSGGTLGRRMRRAGWQGGRK